MTEHYTFEDCKRHPWGTFREFKDGATLIYAEVAPRCRVRVDLAGRDGMHPADSDESHAFAEYVVALHNAEIGAEVPVNG